VGAPGWEGGGGARGHSSSDLPERAHLQKTPDPWTRMLALLSSLMQASPQLFTAIGATSMATSTERARAFERVYTEGRWLHGADGASRCPSGWSDVESGQGAAALKAVTSVVNTFQIHSIADIPCGDGCFAGAMLTALRNRTTSNDNEIPVTYLGIDIVSSLIERNRAQHRGDKNTHFLVADLVGGVEQLPTAELVFSRQMLQHLCNEDALRFVHLVAHSSARFAMLTTFQTDDNFINTDIACTSGGYRVQDLTKPPFSLPKPIAIFSEKYPVDPRASLGLWSIKQLRHRLL
jgi:hypothetical protein